MAADRAAPEELLRELAELERRVQAQAGEDLSFRKLNAGFSAQSETTQVLLGVCEKLAAVKESIQRANFEEHTSELPYLCKHLGTSVEAGLSERTWRERHAARNPAGCGRRDARRGRGLFALCCQQEFPPPQRWWTEMSRQLAPRVQVLRNGKLASSSPGDLVRGDVVYLQAGQQVPVDGRVLVYSPGTTVDASQVTSDPGEVRACSSEPTGESIIGSRNIVLKDSYVITGSLFCMAVRTVGDPLLPCSSRETDDDQFTVDVNLPPGLSTGQCKSAFKALCVQARLACRSFRTMTQLGRVGVLIVLLTQELLSTAGALCTVARRLGRALVFVGCDCGQAELEALAQRSALELLDLREAAAPRAGSLGSASPLRPPAPSRAEAAQLAGLAQRLAGQSAGAVLTGASPAGLARLCRELADAGRPPLYAQGRLDFPDAFRSLVLAPRRAGTRLSTALPPPKGSVVLSGSGRASQAEAQEEAPRPEGSSMSRVQSLGSEATADAGMVSEDPADALALPAQGAEGGGGIELLVALNSIGVVSEHADCVLLRPDLAYLGQALEIATRAFASAPAPPAEPRHA